jgi:DNA mismatch endonuclease (patch repair protein)
MPSTLITGQANPVSSGMDRFSAGGSDGTLESGRRRKARTAYSTKGSLVTTEPARAAPGPALSSKMSRLARKHTKPELEVRRALHAAGLRYRVQYPVPGNRRRTIDVAFTRAKLAVFIDGCFWHSCPGHGMTPTANSEWWQWKLQRNRARDRDTDQVLHQAGWTVLRFWEHESPDAVVIAVRSYVCRGQSDD